MIDEFVICDQEIIEASLVPPELISAPGRCPSGIYETLRVSHGVIKGWDQHWQRFVDTLHHFSLECRWTGIKEKAIALYSGNDSDLKRLRLMQFMEPQTLKNGKLFTRLAFTAPAITTVSNGSFVCDVAESRRRAGDCEFNRKLLGRLDVDIELARSKTAGCDDVIICNDRGEVCESSYGNIGMIINDRILTPPLESPCLPGITMKAVAQFAESLGIKSTEERLCLKDLRDATEIFLTSSVRGVQRVSEVKGWFREDLKSENKSIVKRMIEGFNGDLF